MNSLPDLPPEPVDRTVLVSRLGVTITPALLEQALTHRSYAYERGGIPTNERLEFLGDAVLGVVITDEIYVRYPDLSEGQLAKLRAAVVNMRALAGIAREVDLGPWLLLGRGEETTGGRDKLSILADTLEAVIGAAWLTGGLELCGPFILRLLLPLVESARDLGAGLDWKTSVQELAAEGGYGPPEYLVSESGPDHAKTFTATLVLTGRQYGRGDGHSKKEAEQAAAAETYRMLRDASTADG
jgi:ribonuclease-3